MNKKTKFLFAVSICLFWANISVNAQTTDQEKSFYFNKDVIVCPVDFTRLYMKEGFLIGNSETLDTLKSEKTIETEVDILETGGTSFVKKKQTQKIVIVDTVYKYPMIIKSGFAFNIIQQIGSFTIIKFWPIDNDNPGLLESDSLKLYKKDSVSKVSDLAGLGKLEIDGLEATISINDKPNSHRDKKPDTSMLSKLNLSKGYYLIKTKDLTRSAVEFENKKNLWSIGILIMPVKLRPFATEKGQFDFSDGFSVGTTFSWTFSHSWRKNSTHNFLLYAGISSVTADSTKIKEEREDYKIATFSPAFGYMWEKNGIQLSVMTGIDFPSGNLQQKWVYRNQPWIGFGVGIGLFKINNMKNTSSQEN